jgi:hypothetical protein
VNVSVFALQCLVILSRNVEDWEPLKKSNTSMNTMYTTLKLVALMLMLFKKSDETDVYREIKCTILLCIESISVTWGRSVVFSGLPHQWSWKPRYSWNIAEGVAKLFKKSDETDVYREIKCTILLCIESISGAILQVC